MLKQTIALSLAFMLGLAACDGLPGNEPQYDLTGYWNCEQGIYFLAFTENQMAFREFNEFSQHYLIDTEPYRILQQEGSQTIVDINSTVVWRIQFTGQDTFIAPLNNSESICDRTDKATFDALQPPVVFPVPTAEPSQT